MVSAAEARLRLEPETTSASRARRFVEQLLVEAGRAAVVDSAALLTSELVTNAVLHGRGSEIGVSVHLGDRVRIEVHDNGPGMPLLKDYERDAATGRGLRLVDSLAAVWGVDEVGAGKTVWFELAAGGPAEVPFVVDLDEWPDLEDVEVIEIPLPEGTALVDIKILRMPLEVYRRASQHQDELQREFALIASEPESEHTVPSRLLALIAELNARFGAFTGAAQEQLSDALARGDDTIDLEYRLPADVGAATDHFLALLAEADEYCRHGDTLLTLATPPEAVALREWFLGEFAAQARGGGATPWPGLTG